jgi:hypothetical protein
MSMLELFRVFAMSNEFKLLPVGFSLAFQYSIQCLTFDITSRFAQRRRWSWPNCATAYQSR